MDFGGLLYSKIPCTAINVSLIAGIKEVKTCNEYELNKYAQSILSAKTCLKLISGGLGSFIGVAAGSVRVQINYPNVD